MQFHVFDLPCGDSNFFVSLCILICLCLAQNCDYTTPFMCAWVDRLVVKSIMAAGKFRMVQTFAFFADRSVVAKIRTAKLWTVHVRTVRTQSDRAKIKTTKISYKGLISNSAKFAPAKISRYTVYI